MPGLRQPTLTTERLALRGFRIVDAEPVRLLANDIEIARNTLNIPHPYEREHVESWITSHPDQLRQREAVTYAVTLSADEPAPNGSGSRGSAGQVLGAVGLILNGEHERAELGYWIGRPFWGRGYATEAARAVVRWGFEELDLHRIHASHFPRNPASGRVLEKLGMRHEGSLRQHVRKWGEFVDLEQFGILRSESTGGTG